MSAAKKRRREGTLTAPSLEELDVPTPIRRKLDNHGTYVDPVVVDSSTEKVVKSLRKHGITDETILQHFRDHQIEERHLVELTEKDLTKMGIRAVGSQKDILAAVKTMTSQTEEEKVFNDPIHGHIELHPLMVKVIDTPQFQRLRYLKQLGGGYYVFPGASHNRFEHSIGVGYLAGELVEMLRKKQPELDITPQDVLCVKLAGLCHDLGHGPFSHLFDGWFIPRVLPDTNWKHEDASIMMFQHLIDDNGLMVEMKRYGLDDNDIKFITELIVGLKDNDSETENGVWKYEGRPEAKSFLYEIVANKRTGVDVDKWDYFARDCHYLGVPNSFDLRRYMTFARVIEVDGKRQICTRDKEVTNLYEMFHTRSTLHRRAYQHKTSNIVELMITEALVAANDHLPIEGRGKKLLKMSEAIDDPVAFTKLTDHVLQRIQHSTDPALKPARDILSNLEKRKLYKLIGQAQVTPVLSKRKDGEKIRSEMIKCLSVVDLGDLPELCDKDIVVLITTFDYGMGDDNPIDHMRFYTKTHPNNAEPVHKDQVSQMLPQTFKEQQIRLFCKKGDMESRKSARIYFEKWCSISDKKSHHHEDYKIIYYVDYPASKSIYFSPTKQGDSSTAQGNGQAVKRLFI